MMEAVILAGGMGTRLRSVVADIPKCMAPVAGRPFLYYILIALGKAGFRHAVLSLGYRHEVVEAWIKNYPTPLKCTTVIEDEPLGTGGGVKRALSATEQNEVFVLNGDTFFAVDYPRMLACHKQTKAQATLALKRMEDFSRYGAVEVAETGRILRFLEKKPRCAGLINGGIYLIDRNALNGYPEKFSLEKDFFEPQAPSGSLAGFVSEGYFIDIGIPEDYAQAQIDFANEAYE